jgi:hypothetical protein
MPETARHLADRTLLRRRAPAMPLDQRRHRPRPTRAQPRRSALFEWPPAVLVRAGEPMKAREQGAS